MTIPVCLFWVMIGVIVGLVGLVLIRDQGIRGGIAGMSNWVRRKIRVARIKGQIQKENQKKEDLVKTLGETVWKSGASAPFVEAQLEEARKLTGDEKKWRHWKRRSGKGGKIGTKPRDRRMNTSMDWRLN